MILIRFTLLALCLSAGPALAKTLVLVSDLNGRYGSTEYHPRVTTAVQAIIEGKPDAVISVGDMVAGQQKPLLESPKLNQMWAGFNRTVADPLQVAGIPLAVTPGNHDGSGFAEFQLERQHFEDQWGNRTEGLDILPGSEWPRRYAARIGDVLLITFDGTRPGKLPAKEIKFVETMLSQHSATAETIIAFSHLPMWPLATGREKEILKDSNLLDLLHRFNVDIYASGHHHVFYAGADEAGMLHVAVGALGGNARSFSGATERQKHSYVLIDLHGAVPEIRAMASPGFSQPIDPATLPARIDGPTGRLERVPH